MADRHLYGHLINCLVRACSGFFLRYNTNRFVLQELRKACGAGFLIMINYIYNHMVYFTRMREFAWSVSDCEELVGVSHRKRCWSWGKIFRQYRAIL